MVNTEWIGFLDDDDTINPKYVETLLSNYNKNLHNFLVKVFDKIKENILYV